MKKSDIKSLTLPDYWVFLCDVLEGKKCQGKVIKLVSVGMWGTEWTYIVPNGIKTTDEYLDAVWEYEPLMKRYFNNKEEMLAQAVRSQWDDCSAVFVRCIFREDEIAYQCVSTFPKDHDGIVDAVASLMHYSETDLFFGFRRDPYTFIEEKKIKDGEYIDDGRHDPEVRKYNTDENNYRVFYVEMEPEEFLKEEKAFLDHVKTGEYKDDFYVWERYKDTDGFSKVWKEFLKENTKIEFKDDD